MPLTELPFNFTGRIFRSPMPFGHFDPEGKAFEKFKEVNIDLIVLLADEQECLEKAKRNLRELYLQEGFDVIYLPMLDFDIPRKEDLKSVIDQIIEQAKVGKSIAIHCHAGIGRTGLVAACLARQILGLSGKEAVEWTRHLISGAIETPNQMRMVFEYE